MKHKIVVSAALAMTLAAATAVTAYAADDSYGYLAGERQSRDRRAQFEQTALSSDQEQQTFFETRDASGSKNSDAQHLDAQALADAGVIDQETADAFKEYACGKHDRIHGRFNGMDAMTPSERHTAFAACAEDCGDSVEALLDAGVITQEQADAINDHLAQ